MTLQHVNRVRRTDRQAAREAQAAEVYERSDDGIPAAFEVRRRAYLIYLDRNGAPGDPVADWLRAESELRPVRR